MRNKETLNDKNKIIKRVWEGVCPPLFGSILFARQSSWPVIADQQDLSISKLSHIIDENKHIVDTCNYVTIVIHGCTC